MKGYNITIDLLKLGLPQQGKLHPFVTDMTGKQRTVKCLVIPVDDCDLALGANADNTPSIKLQLTAFESIKEGYLSSHFVKQHFSKIAYDSIPEEERRKSPILGNAYPFGDQGSAAPQQPPMALLPANGQDTPF